MSRRGNCHDNAVAESFFATFKKRVTKKKIYKLVKMLREKYLILLKCFTIQSSGIATLAACLPLGLKKTIFRG